MRKQQRRPDKSQVLLVLICVKLDIKKYGFSIHTSMLEVNYVITTTSKNIKNFYAISRNFYTRSRRERIELICSCQTNVTHFYTRSRRERIGSSQEQHYLN